jgi:Na+/H+ antiporter NhaD/arsenite permease-like protein
VLCFVGLVITLFFESKDYLSYAVLFMLIAALMSTIFLPEARELDTYINAIEWEVVFFFLPMLIILVILEPVFEEIALRIIKRQSTHDVKKLFFVICVMATVTAAVITATSTVLLFIPIVIRLCKQLKINPAPFMMGVSICINLAATLTPFGSAQNVVIYSHFKLDAIWFFTMLGPYFLITITITLLLLEYSLIRNKNINEWAAVCSDHQIFEKFVDEEEHHVQESMDPQHFKLNLLGLAMFFILLLFIREIYVVALIALSIFVFVNPVKHSDGKKRADLAHYASKADYKLVYFFICLFILTHLMEINGTLQLFEDVIEETAHENLFILAIEIMILTSIISGLLDNAPVTILFLPIMDSLIEVFGNDPVAFTVLLVAFILGINLGSNFLPQGSAADMMNLEFARKYCVDDMNFKRLTKVGASFAVIHVLIGIAYIWVLILIL